MTSGSLLFVEEPEDRPRGPGVEAIYGRPTPHCVIRASAGSGKTYQLATRYLRLILHGAEPDAILATTFTRKAAGEIQARVLGWLAQAAADEEARRELSGAIGTRLHADDCCSMLRRLAAVLHRLPIATIDSFFHRIARGFQYELDLPPEPVLVDEGHPLAVQLRRQAIEAMLGDDDLSTMLALLRRLHHDAAQRSVTQAIDAIVCNHHEVYRQAPDEAAWTRLRVAGLLDSAELQRACGAFLEAAEVLPDHKGWREAYAKAREALLRSDWESFAGCGIIEKRLAGAEDYYRKPWPAALGDAIDALGLHARAALVDRVAQQTHATFELLRRFDAHDAALRRQHGLILFSDLTHKLARFLPVLGDETLIDVYYRLDGWLQHLLLDEFQDTSVDQWTVLEPFAGEVASHVDGSRSFFCVGDVKQAIYGWRGGCATLLDHVEAMLPPESCESLSRSWRSAPAVLDAVNVVFDGLPENPALLGQDAATGPWAAGFETHRSAKEDLRGYVELCTSLSPPGDDAPRGGEGEEEITFTEHEAYAAERIAELHAAAPGATIGVLVATNRMVNLMLYHLRSRGLPVSGEGGSPVTDCIAVNAVLSALTLADHPGDRAAAFHVLNSPLGPVVGLAEQTPRATREVSLAIRRQLLSRGYAATLAVWVRGVAPACDGRALRRLMQLIELADAMDAGPAPLRPTEFVRYVEATRVEDPTPAPIRVMTIHASKGLEFDAVVLPELDRPLPKTPALLIDRPDPIGPIRGVYRYAKEFVREQDEGMQAAYDAYRCAELQEDLCNLYVAMTRPKRALHMIVRPLKPRKDGSPGTRGWSNLSFASIVRRALGPGEPDFEGDRVLYRSGDARWASDFASSEPSRPSPPARRLTLESAVSDDPLRRGLVQVAPSALEGDARTRAADLLYVAPDAGRRYGSLIHAWCEKVGFIDEDPDGPADDQLREAASQLAWEGDVEPTIELFRRQLGQPAIRAALRRPDTPHRIELWCERPFAVRIDGTLLRGRFDRVVVQRDGETGRAVAAELFDFKTDAVDGVGVSDATTHYRPQLTAYRRALAAMLRLPPAAVAARLVFLHAGAVRSI